MKITKKNPKLKLAPVGVWIKKGRSGIFLLGEKRKEVQA